MILVLKQGITKEEKERLQETLRSEDYLVKEIKGVEETILGVVGKIRRDIGYYEASARRGQGHPHIEPL